MYISAFFLNDTASTEIYSLSLHDALPIYRVGVDREGRRDADVTRHVHVGAGGGRHPVDMNRSEEHTSELQSRLHLVCRLLLEKKKLIMQCLACARILRSR